MLRNPIIEEDITKVNLLQKKLLAWYKLNHRNFLWRNNGLSQYEYIIAEVLLQRTRAETVAKIYSNFIIRYPNWEKLALANIEQLEEFLRPIGLYKQRSKRLLDLASEVVKRRGIIPSKRVELINIPLMGHYISNAVELLIFGKRRPLLDVNMARVLERVFTARKLVDLRYDPYLENLSTSYVNHSKSKELNWAILDFAALVCKPKPQCLKCPIANICNHYMRLSKQ